VGLDSVRSREAASCARAPESPAYRLGDISKQERSENHALSCESPWAQQSRRCGVCIAPAGCCRACARDPPPALALSTASTFASAISRFIGAPPPPHRTRSPVMCRHALSAQVKHRCHFIVIPAPALPRHFLPPLAALPETRCLRRRTQEGGDRRFFSRVLKARAGTAAVPGVFEKLEPAVAPARTRCERGKSGRTASRG